MAKFIMNKGVPTPKKAIIDSNELAESFKTAIIKKNFGTFFPIQNVSVFYNEFVLGLDDLDVKVPKSIGVSIKGDWCGKVSGFYLSKEIYEITGEFAKWRDDKRLKDYIDKLINHAECKMLEMAIKLLKEKQNE